MSESAVAGELREDSRTELVSALLPLSLLESIRVYDQPKEILEDEDPTVVLPRRLGLSSVVDNQIRHYQSVGNGSVSLEEVVGLIKLVLKRDDASVILRETGRRVADQYYRTMSNNLVRTLRVMPGKFLSRSWQRSARRLLRLMVGDATVEVVGPPPVVRLRPSPLALFEPVGVACALYGSGLERLAELFTGGTPYSIETQCCSNGEQYCEWTISGI